MNVNLLSIIGAGILTLLMALFHMRFPVLFLWRAEFKKMTESNHRIFFTIHIALLLIFVLWGGVLLVYSRELAQPNHFTRGFLFGAGLFWIWRTVWQLAYFKPSRNRRLRKYFLLHYLLCIWFFVLSVLYLIPVFNR